MGLTRRGSMVPLALALTTALALSGCDRGDAPDDVADGGSGAAEEADAESDEPDGGELAAYVGPGDDYQVDFPASWEIQTQSESRFTASAPQGLPDVTAAPHPIPAGEHDRPLGELTAIAGQATADTSIEPTSVPGSAEAVRIEHLPEDGSVQFAAVAARLSDEEFLLVSVVWDPEAPPAPELVSSILDSVRVAADGTET